MYLFDASVVIIRLAANCMPFRSVTEEIILWGGYFFGILLLIISVFGLALFFEKLVNRR